MNDLIEFLTEIAEDFDVTVHTDYSGRSMYGKTCFGLSGSFRDLWNVVQEAAMETETMIRSPNKDNLGYDEIWYWPNGIEG